MELSSVRVLQGRISVLSRTTATPTPLPFPLAPDYPHPSPIPPSIIEKTPNLGEDLNFLHRSLNLRVSSYVLMSTND